ncbi:MAG: four helix bundle protein [Acidobacteria bacterium]|nr:four helix bundle protein [Acidobacteriota bacterium]
MTSQGQGPNEKKQGSKGYKDLLVWQKGIELVKETYKLTRDFPSDEKFGLVSQMRRAAVSVPSNIAEGQARHTTKEFIQFISHAEGSLAELETQVIVSTELAYCDAQSANRAQDLAGELKRMLNALRRTLERKSD